MIGIWLIFIVFMLISWLVSNQLKSRFKKYSHISTSNGMSGKEVAEKMLRDHGIMGIRIGSVQGQLSDHYNPAEKTINLSKDVYFGRNVAAAAVAAHETGHAIQHAQAYTWLNMRSALVPIVSFSSKWMQWVLLAGILLMNTFPQLLLAGIVMFAVTTLFSIITLPVEVDASQRAIKWLKTTGITNYESQQKAEDALRWAAYTYFVAALASLATLLYYVMLYMGRRN
ncbi:zinc metallopeptidase [Ancylomarina longa]|uniref:Zinc metallopeptidase n=1 Tax=Ancylomarina longa TaxID=2487017 RepID=A0A434AUI5_9BACT|nr:zinc metallopeptidase [Ancylomarina longa]RUT78112.1 zinc metallopeptidase [Ancylomarina longa]